MLVEYASLWQQLAERHIAPVFKAWPAYANGAYRQNSLLLSIAAYHIFSARCFYCGVVCIF